MADEAPTATDDAATGDDKGTPTPTPTDDGKTPKWDGEFDADRAARLVANLRDDVAKRDRDLADLRARVEAGSGNEKTLQDRLATLEDRAAKAERDLVVAKVAKEHSLPEDLLDLLTAKDEDGLKAQAERLAAHVKKPADDVPGKPKPKLTPGRGGDPEDDFDARKVASDLRRR